MVQVVSFSCTLTHTRKYGIPAVFCCNITDQLLDKDSLAHPGAAKQTNLTTLLVGAEKVYDFDTGLQKFCFCCLLFKCRRRSVNRLVTHPFRCRFIVYWFSQYVENTSQCIFSNRYGNRCSGGNRLHPPYQTVGRTHGDTFNRIVTQMLCRFHNQFSPVFGRNMDCFINFRELPLTELDVQDSTDNLSDLSTVSFCHLFHSFDFIGIH